MAGSSEILRTHLLANTSWGFFGGAFDPPHAGHVGLARALCAAGQLDGVIFAPSFHPPHKSIPQASFSQRMEMCEMVCAAEPRFIVSDIESGLTKPGYTVEVVRELQDRYRSVRFSVLIGADNLRTLASWNRVDSLLRMAPLLVGARAISGADSVLEAITRDTVLEQGIPPDLLDRVQIVQSPLIDISSSALRAELILGGDNPETIQTDVFDYIKENKLYR